MNRDKCFICDATGESNIVDYNEQPGSCFMCDGTGFLITDEFGHVIEKKELRSASKGGMKAIIESAYKTLGIRKDEGDL